MERGRQRRGDAKGQGIGPYVHSLQARLDEILGDASRLTTLPRAICGLYGVRVVGASFFTNFYVRVFHSSEKRVSLFFKILFYGSTAGEPYFQVVV